ncbi:MAG: LytR C-terminal domain-containing protein [Candidatus Marinimicrobia bacterium]|nr:LytR C-terminal domain-containing protein [Candidatus Neomarinimicrobiota bacterium]
MARRTVKRSNYKKRKKTNIRNPDIQKWFLNLAIFSLSIVIVGFIFSMGKRLVQNPDKVVLSQVNEVIPNTVPYQGIVIEVLNGCGVPGLAQKFTNFLRSEGFDVMYTGNADRIDYPNTQLIERVDDSEKTNEVNDVLMLHPQRLSSDLDPSLHVDLTLILGKDYNRLPVYEKVLALREIY